MTEIIVVGALSSQRIDGLYVGLNATIKLCQWEKPDAGWCPKENENIICSKGNFPRILNEKKCTGKTQFLWKINKLALK